MQLPRVRFTVRRMMVAVALAPIVLLAGVRARDSWPVFSSTVEIDRPGQVRGAEWTLVVEQEFSVWPSLLAMTATTAVLALLWMAVERWGQGLRRKRPNSPPKV